MTRLMELFYLLALASAGVFEQTATPVEPLDLIDSNETHPFSKALVTLNETTNHPTRQSNESSFVTTTPLSTSFGNFSEHHGFLDGFISSFTVSVLSELGDRSFFTAVILSVTYSRVLVFFGQMAAQTIMTAASIALSFATHLMPRWLTHYLSIGLFVCFGLKMLYEAVVQFRFETTDVQELEREVEAKTRRRWFSGAFFAAFGLTLFAECGDRSQISTIVLAATKNVYGVGLGTILGHALITLCAVAAGRIISAVISVKYLTLAGALIFFAFAIVAGIQGYD